MANKNSFYVAIYLPIYRPCRFMVFYSILYVFAPPKTKDTAQGVLCFWFGLRVTPRRASACRRDSLSSKSDKQTFSHYLMYRTYELLALKSE